MGTRRASRDAGDKSGGAAVVLHAYDLCKALHEAVLRFPRVERPGLGTDLERECRAVLGHLVEARMSPDKTATLRAASVELEKLRFLVRMSSDFRLVSVGQYEALSGQVDEVGRMIGGWTKWAGAARPPDPEPP